METKQHATTPTTTDPCQAHRMHVPEPTYSEIHHIIPQAWQIAWQPAQPWPNAGPSPDHTGLTLFDAHTVTLCRTGHGNVHDWLVKVMRQLATLAASGGVTDPDTPDAVAAAWKVVRHDARAAHRHVVTIDTVYADDAMQRWLEQGGSLAFLIAHRLWGEI